MSEVNGDLYATVQGRVDVAGTNGTVTLFDGTYDESLTIATEGLTLEGAGASEAIVGSSHRS